MNKNILVIYEIVPEDTRIYELEVSEEELTRMSRCHGALSNTVGHSEELDGDLEWLNQFLGDKDPIMTADGSCPPHSGGKYDAIILTGFHL